MAIPYLGMFCSAYLLVGLSNSFQVLILTHAMERGLEKDPQRYRKFIPEILAMESLIERRGWPLLLAQFTLFWPLFLRQMLAGWAYVLVRALHGIVRVIRFILLMGVDMRPK